MKVSMRAMGCPDDGHHMEADNDEELFKLARQHTNEAPHPEAQLTDEQVRTIVAERTLTTSSESRAFGAGVLWLRPF